MRTTEQLDTIEILARKIVPNFPWNNLRGLINETPSSEIVKNRTALANELNRLAERTAGHMSDEQDQVHAYGLGLVEYWDKVLADRAAGMGGPTPVQIWERDAEGMPIMRTRNGKLNTNTETWIDRKNGQPVHVLAPEQSFASPKEVGYGLGDLLRALALGRKSDGEILALSEGSVSSGGAVVSAPLSNVLLDAMRAASIVVGLGARSLQMTSATLSIARVVTDPKPSWREETEDVAEADVVFDRLEFKARNMSFLVKVSRELLEDSANLNEEMRALFGRVSGAELDRVVLAGGGTSPSSKEPEGLLTMPLVNEQAAVGALSSYDAFLDAYEQIITANCPAPTGIAWDPHTMISCQKLKEGQTNSPLRAPDIIAAMDKRTSTALSPGGSPLLGNAILGGWPELYIATRTAIDITLLRERYADKGMFAWWVWLRMDCQCAHPKAFARLLSIG